MSRILAVQKRGLTPYVAFDCQSLPSKLITNQKHQEEWHEALLITQQL